MNKQRILLVAPIPENEKTLRSEPPLGLAYIASCLQIYKHEVEIFDMAVEKINIYKKIELFQPSIVAIQVMTQNRYFVFELAEYMKNEFDNNFLIVVGGPHITLNTASEIFANVKSIDIAVRGEGEMSIAKIANGHKLSDILGISYRKNNLIVHNNSQPVLKLCELPLPAYHLLKINKYKMKLNNKKAMSIFTSRGCPNKCIYCAVGNLGNQVRYDSVEKILSTIDFLKKECGIRKFIIEDDAFGINKRFRKQILNGLDERNIEFAIKTRVNILTPDFINLLYNTGCVKVNYGVETGSESILKKINKNINLSQVIEVQKNCNKSGIQSNVYFMAGNIFETKIDLKKSLDFSKKLYSMNANPIWAWGVFIFPGTKLEQIARKQNVLPPDFSWTDKYYNVENLNLGNSPYIPIVETQELKIKDIIKFKNDYNDFINPFNKITDLLPKFIQNNNFMKNHYRRVINR